MVWGLLVAQGSGRMSSSAVTKPRSRRGCVRYRCANRIEKSGRILLWPRHLVSSTALSRTEWLVIAKQRLDPGMTRISRACLPSVTKDAFFTLQMGGYEK